MVRLRSGSPPTLLLAHRGLWGIVAVDGFHPANMGNLARLGEDLRHAKHDFDTRVSSNAACTPLGCIELLDREGVELQGKHAVVLGRSNIVGMPVALMLLHRDATVSVCHSRTKNIAEVPLPRTAHHCSRGSHWCGALDTDLLAS